MLDRLVAAKSGVIGERKQLDESQYQTSHLLVLRNRLHFRRHRAHQLPRRVQIRRFLHHEFHRVGRHARRLRASQNSPSGGAQLAQEHPDRPERSDSQGAEHGLEAIRLHHSPQAIVPVSPVSPRAVEEQYRQVALRKCQRQAERRQLAEREQVHELANQAISGGEDED